MQTITTAVPPKSDLAHIVAMLDVGRELEPRYGTLALWFLTRIAECERVDTHIGREALAQEAQPCPRTTAYSVLAHLEDEGYIERFRDPENVHRRPMRTTKLGKLFLARVADTLH